MLFKVVCNKLFEKNAFFFNIQLGMSFIKRWEYTNNLLARVYITQSCFLVGKHFKIITNSGIFFADLWI